MRRLTSVLAGLFIVATSFNCGTDSANIDPDIRQDICGNYARLFNGTWLYAGNAFDGEYDCTQIGTSLTTTILFTRTGALPSYNDQKFIGIKEAGGPSHFTSNNIVCDPATKRNTGTFIEISTNTPYKCKEN